MLGNILTPTNLNFALVGSILSLSIYITLRTGLFSLANAAFMSIGAYVGALMTINLHTPLWLSVIGGALAAGLVGLILGLPVLRLHDIYLAIATIGFGEVVRVFWLNVDRVMGRTLVGGALGLNGIPKTTQTWHLIVLLVILGYFFMRMEAGPIGRALRAIREDEKVAAGMGVNVFGYKVYAFVFGAMIAGVAGVMSAHLTRFIGPNEFGFDLAVQILAFAVLGGSQVWFGPIVGAFILTLMPEALRFLKANRAIVNGSVLMLVIIYMPNGLISPSLLRRRRKRVKETAVA